jgi:hypothetical protein
MANLEESFKDDWLKKDCFANDDAAKQSQGHPESTYCHSFQHLMAYTPVTNRRYLMDQ